MEVRNRHALKHGHLARAVHSRRRIKSLKESCQQKAPDGDSAGAWKGSARCLLGSLLAFIYYFDISFQWDDQSQDDIGNNGAEEAQA